MSWTDVAAIGMMLLFLATVWTVFLYFMHKD